MEAQLGHQPECRGGELSTRLVAGSLRGGMEGRARDIKESALAGQPRRETLWPGSLWKDDGEGGRAGD